MKKNLLLSLALTGAMTTNVMASTSANNMVENNAASTVAENAAITESNAASTVATNTAPASAAPATSIELTGCVADSLTHEGEPMATLRVWKMGEKRDNSKAAAMGTTDIDGRFSLQISQRGEYVLMVTSIGRTPVIKPFSVEKGKKVIDLGTMLMSESAEELQDVVVAVQRPLVKMEGDKIAYSVKDDPDAKTNTLLEMLRKVPMVTVDGEENIKVNGSSDFLIFMNGKPSAMLSGNPKETLKAIPAQSIKHIEVLTNPGAKYDAEGVGGILNFITDQQQGMEGYTANISLMSGNRMNGGSVYVMTQKDKLTLSANASEVYMNSPEVENTNVRQNLIDHSTMTNETSQTGGNNMLFATIDATYQIDSLNTISATVNVMDMRSKTTTDILTRNVPGSEYSQTNDNRSTSTSLNTSLDFTHTFADDARHSLSAAYRFSTQPRKNDMNTQYSGISLPDYDYTDKNNMQEHTLQLDYTQPLAESIVWEAGGKYVWRQNTSNSDQLDYEHSNSIGALYTTYSQKLGQFNLKGGLRYEFTSQEVSYKKGNGEDFSLTFHNWVPNLTLSFAPSMSQNLSLAYNMRLSRPGISVLNPYRNTQLIHSVTYGNPNLDIETSHNLQLTYSYFSAKAMLNASLGYSYLDNGIEQYSYLKEGVLYSTYANIGQRQNTTLSLFASLSLTSTTRLTLNSSTSYIDMRASEMGCSNSGWTQMLMLNLQQNLPWDMKLSLMYMMNTPSINLQGKTAGINIHTIGLTKSCLNDRLSFSINAINPLHSTMKMKIESQGEGYTNVSDSKIGMASVMASASYRFGDMKLKQQTRTTMLDSDVKEVKDSNEQMNGVFRGM